MKSLLKQGIKSRLYKEKNKKLPIDQYISSQSKKKKELPPGLMISMEKFMNA